ncbi:hypothetical protein JCM1841_005278 [Sporobolomyces salmonicolor]
MGVRDLLPFVKKVAPSCITPHTSLRAFAGARFAIDANLLTTKFHFSSPSLGEHSIQRRHIVQQWYAFLQALERSKIQPIVVFDGETRVKQKERENERRRKARELERLRGEAEGTRGERLKRLREVWRRVGTEDRAAVVKGIRDALERRQEGVAEAKVEAAQPLETIETLVDGMRDALERRQEGVAEAKVEVAQPLETIETLVDGVRQALEQPAGPTGATTEAAQPHEAVQTLLGLYDHFRSDEANPIYSKHQALITGDEGAFFQMILAQEVVNESPTVDLEHVIARSDQLGASHVVRSAPVRAETHIAVRELVDALGVPVVVPSPSEPHEAEGLCATLCSLGLADYVVSEDTDVTVYGAPLLRQISIVDEEQRNMNRKDGRLKESMQVVDPVKLREALGLTKEQFVDFALLCGTDFTERIPLLGPTKALLFIREHSTIEAILAHYPKYRPVGDDLSAYLQTIRAARAIFLSLPPLPVSPPGAHSSSAATDLAPSPSPASVPLPADDPLGAFLSPRRPTPDAARVLQKWGIDYTTRVAETDTAATVRAAAASDDGVAGEAAVERMGTGERMDFGVAADEWLKKRATLRSTWTTRRRRGGDRRTSSLHRFEQVFL